MPKTFYAFPYSRKLLTRIQHGELHGIVSQEQPAAWVVFIVHDVCVCVVYNNFSPPEHRSRDITSIVILHNPIKQKLIAKPTPNLLQYNFEIYLLENCEKHACSIIGKISLDQRKLRLGSKFEWLDLMNWLAFQFWWVDRKCDPAGLGFFFVLVLGRRPLGRWWRWRHGGQLQSN